jgi:DNA-binding MarR family transcriptional regulator/GNAT superfamily N-acetyltransferase
MTRPAQSHVDAVRRFNRFYTRFIGVLDAGHLASPFSLTEVRVLYELAHREAPTASDLADDLGLDAGYLSRILRRFQRMRLITRAAAAGDRRRSHLSLTRAGRNAFRPLDRKATGHVAALLGRAGSRGRGRLVQAMREIHAALDPAAGDPPRPVVLRHHRPGDMGWVVHRHGALYAAEYGYSDRFEALVARVAADFIDHLEPARERCWIAERDGEIVGSVFLVRKTAAVAKLRLLYVEPEARGIGLGRRLVDACIAFARRAGYRRITLWTQQSLTAARHIYESAGFVLTGSVRHADFGPREIAETWELSLARPRARRRRG